MEQTVDRGFTLGELSELLESSMGSLPDVLDFDRRAYLEGTYPVEVTQDPIALLERFKDLEQQLQKCIGEPVVCFVEVGDTVLVNLGTIESGDLKFQFYQDSDLPGGSVGVHVSRHMVFAIDLDEHQRPKLEFIHETNPGEDTYFHIERRAFHQEGEDSFVCKPEELTYAIGSDSIARTFGATALFLPSSQGLTIPSTGVIEARGIELPR